MPLQTHARAWWGMRNAAVGVLRRRVRTPGPHGRSGLLSRRRGHPTRASPGPRLLRRGLRRPRAAGRIDWAHEADGIAVGVLDHGVACAPERVVWLLLDGVAGGGEVGAEAIDLFARCDAEADDD